MNMGNMDDQQKMMMQFPSMFNQFMMQSMAQPNGHAAQNGKSNAKSKQATKNGVPVVPPAPINPQVEQFQIKMMDMVKKLQKKCDQIFSEVNQKSNGPSSNQVPKTGFVSDSPAAEAGTEPTPRIATASGALLSTRTR